MSLILGENTFATVEQADQYIAENYVSTDAYRVKWSTLSTTDKEALLRSSTSAISNLKFPGSMKMRISQPLAFPRCGIFTAGDISRPHWQYFDNSVYPTKVTDGGVKAAMEATVENALAKASLDTYVQSNAVNNIIGLKSKSVGPIKEDYNSNAKEARMARQGIYTDKVYVKLVVWLGDAFANI